LYQGLDIFILSTRTDITAKKEFEEQQLKMLNQTKMAAMGEMLGNIAHQWRQPLSIITTIASSTSLKQEHGILKEEKLHENMEKIVESAEYLSNTIETFRNFLKSEKEYKPVSIQNSIKEVLQILNTTITSNNITLINNADKVDDITIVMISSELEQVIINIINNAKDVFIERDIKDRFITIDLSKDETRMKLSIEDNGGGIPKEILPKVFEAYFTTKHQSQGTGLGLHMSYRIITESLKGQLYAVNTNTGAKFIIEIPINNS
jgi:C4-dicarboxylate-specific signal transduction histidine kinase